MIASRTVRIAIAALAVIASVAIPGAQLAQAASDKWGFNDDWGIAAPGYMDGNAYPLAREAGLGWVRYWLYWSHVNPSPGVYDWSVPDQAVKTAQDNGLKVYMTIMWAPQWATGNQPSYIPWACMNPTTGAYDSSRPGCAPGIAPDQAAFQAFVKAAVSRYGSQVKHWGFWNESHERLFWRGADIVDQIMIPGYEAAKSANPSVVIVGPDETNPGLANLENILKRDLQYRQSTGHGFIDVISFHPYGNGAAHILSEIDNKFKPLIDAYRNGRPVWIGESGCRSDSNAANLSAQAACIKSLYEGVNSRTWIDKFFLYGWKSRSDAGMDYQVLFADGRPRPAYDAIKSFTGGQALGCPGLQLSDGQILSAQPEFTISAAAGRSTYILDISEDPNFSWWWNNGTGSAGGSADRIVSYSEITNSYYSQGHVKPAELAAGKNYYVRAFAYNPGADAGCHSSIVRFTVKAAAPATSILNLKLQGLEGRSNISAAGKVYVYSSGKALLQSSNVLFDAAGNATVSLNVAPQPVLVKVEVAKYLARVMTGVNLADASVKIVPTLRAGDLNGDNFVNSLDFSLINSKWFSSDSTVDLNADGIINSLDYSIINSNWFAAGESI